MKFTGETRNGGRGRRALLSAAGVALTTGLAGCSGVLERSGNGNENGSDGNGTNESDGESADTADASDESEATAELRETLAAADPYRMHQYGPAHVGTAGDAGPTDDVDAIWTFRRGGDDSHYRIGTPAVVDGTVYVTERHSADDGGAETVVYAVDGATGEIEWEWTHPHGANFGSTVVAEGAVVLGLGSSIVAIEIDSRTERWRLERDFATEIAVADGTVYAIDTTYSDPPTLVAIDLETGRERWTEPLTDGMYRPTPPAVTDGTVYQGGLEFTALSAADGERLWSRDFGNAVTGPPTVTDDACYVPLGDGTVAALERDGTPRWRQPVERGGRGWKTHPVSSPAVADGTLYLTNSWRLSALDAETGTERWSIETEGDRPPVVADGVVYVSGLNTVAAYDGTDGTRRWRYRTGATSGSGKRIAPVVGGTVFYPSAGLHALRETGDSS